MSTDKQLTMEQYNALKIFRSTRVVSKTQWKVDVRKLWSKGIAYDDIDSIVYALRNTHGPSWLKKFNLDKCPIPRTISRTIEMNVSTLLDPIQEAAALLDARNETPHPTYNDLLAVERHLTEALDICKKFLL